MRTMSWKKWIIGMLSILVVVFAALGFKFMPVSAEAITVDDPDDLYNTVLGASTDKKTEIQLTEDIKLNSYLWVSSGCDVTIDLNGHKLSNVTGQWVIVIADNGKLTLVDSSNGGGVITNEIQYSGCSLIYNYGTLITGVNLTVPATSTVGYTSTNDVTILSAPSSAAAAGKYAKPSVTVTGGKLLAKPYAGIRVDGAK